ncbi:hypothetical protein DW203_18890 [Citrobacter portucalensis]|nr:hypothetical protein DW203_18890 [Citrobacter portucalensis]
MNFRRAELGYIVCITELSRGLMDLPWVIEKMLPAVVGFAGAWFGSRWGYKKYQKEKFWDAKLKAYSIALSSVENIAFWGLANNKNQVIEYRKDIGHFTDDAIFRDSMRELIAVTYSCSMYFSEEMLIKLKAFINDAKGLSTFDHKEFEGEDAEGIRDIIFGHSERLKILATEKLAELNSIALKDIG